MQAVTTARAQVGSGELQLDVATVPAWEPLLRDVFLSLEAVTWAGALSLCSRGTVDSFTFLGVFQFCLAINIYSLLKGSSEIPKKICCIIMKSPWVCPGMTLPVQLASTFPSEGKVIFW